MIAPQIFEDTVSASWVPQEADAEMMLEKRNFFSE